MISHSWSLQPLKRVWRIQGIFLAAGQFLYMKVAACVTGRADGKPELRVKAVMLHLYNKGFNTFSVSQLLGSCFLFFLVPHDWIVLFLILVRSQRVIENSQWVEVLRKPPQQADEYLPSWPLRTHCARAWRVVVDPFNSTPQRKR